MIYQTIKKNLKVLLKNKLSLIILFLGPILIIFMMGFFYYNANVYNINLGVYIPDENNINTIIFMQKIDSSGFNIIKVKTLNSCENDIKSGTIHACIIFPENFEITENSTNEIVVKLDNSRGDIVSITQNLLLDQIDGASKQIQYKYTNDLINVIEKTENSSISQKDKLIELKKLNNEMKKLNLEIERNLVSLDFTFSSSRLNPNKLKERISKLNKSIISFTTETFILLNNSQSYLYNASTIISSINNSQQAELKKLIDDTKIEVNFALSKTESLSNEYHLKKLFDDFNELKKSINNAKNNLEDLTNSIDKTIKNSNNISTNFENSFDYLILSNSNILDEIANIKVKDTNAIITPINIKVDNVGTKSKSHLSSLFPSLIISLIFIISIILSSTFVLGERKSMAFFRNFLGKNSAIKFLISDFLTLLFIVFIQINFIVLIYYFIFLKLFGLELLFLELALLLIISVFVLIGMFLGYVTKNETANVILSFFVILIFLAFSGTILPIEILSQSLINITMLNPYLISESIIRKILLFGNSFILLKFEFIVLFIYFLILFFINWVLESFSKKRWLYQVYVSINLKFKNREKRKEI